MRFALLLGLLIGVCTWRGVVSRGGMGGGGRGGGGGGGARGGGSHSSSSSSAHASSSPSHAGGTPRSGAYSSPSYHSSGISHSSFTSSLLTSMAISSMFHHTMSPYSHRYVYVAQDEKAPFRTNVTESRDYYFGEENIPVDNCTEMSTGLNGTTGDDTIDLILAQTSLLLDNSSTVCNVCSYKIDENSTEEWAAIEFKDGSRPSTIAWKCKKSEICCGLDCCDENAEGDLKWWMIVLISIGSAIVVLLLIKCLVSLRKWCTKDTKTRELAPVPAPNLTKLDAPPPPSAPLPPARPQSAASLSGVQPNLPRKQRKYQ